MLSFSTLLSFFFDDACFNEHDKYYIRIWLKQRVIIINPLIFHENKERDMYLKEELCAMNAQDPFLPTMINDYIPS